MIARSADQLIELGTLIFEAAGCPPAVAERVATSLVGANLAGHDSHGVIRIPTYVTALKAGHIIPDAQPTIRRETSATAQVDGGWAFGQISAAYATDVAITKAKAEGVSVVAVVRCNHIGRLGEYATTGSEAGLVLMVLTGGFRDRGLSAVPFGGATRALGTNPLSVGIPAGDEPDVLVDIATTSVAVGKIHVARAKGEQLPPGTIVDRDGRPTNDPEAYYQGGALLPFGGHKGYALGVMVELLSRVVTGADAFADDRQRDPVYSHSGTLVIAVDPNVFGEPDRYAAEADRTIRELKAVPPAPGTSGVLIPGEPEARSRADRLANGVPLPEETWTRLLQAARDLGVELPESVGAD